MWIRTWLLVTLMLASVGCADTPPPELAEPPLGTLPTWSFVNEKGRPIGSEQLSGQPFAANFLFTSCPSSCPPLAKATARLQSKVQLWRRAGGPKIVSISVDPASDTPEALRTFGRKYKADPKIWNFARSDYKAMENLVVRGFYQPIIRKDRKLGMKVEEIADKPTPIDTAHGLRFVLVDGQGRMRALYEKDDASLAKLDAGLRWLSEHPGK
ncbi:MAG: SCO family protein [Myxococcales bacterium]|nr:SCO family protein [Myxococcales bacterium]